MRRIVASFVLICALVLTAGLAGCSSQPAGSTSGPPAEQATTDHTDHGAHSHGDHADHTNDGQSAMKKMKSELVKLSPEDAAAAEEQHVCPVSGELLGTMGTPKKIDVSGQQVWICCDGCKDKLLDNPDEYLANLKKE